MDISYYLDVFNRVDWDIVRWESETQFFYVSGVTPLQWELYSYILVKLMIINVLLREFSRNAFINLINLLTWVLLCLCVLVYLMSAPNPTWFLLISEHGWMTTIMGYCFFATFVYWFFTGFRIDAKHLINMSNLDEDLNAWRFIMCHTWWLFIVFSIVTYLFQWIDLSTLDSLFLIFMTLQCFVAVFHIYKNLNIISVLFAISYLLTGFTIMNMLIFFFVATASIFFILIFLCAGLGGSTSKSSVPEFDSEGNLVPDHYRSY